MTQREATPAEQEEWVEYTRNLAGALSMALELMTSMPAGMVGVRDPREQGFILVAIAMGQLGATDLEEEAIAKDVRAVLGVFDVDDEGLPFTNQQMRDAWDVTPGQIRFFVGRKSALQEAPESANGG
jgi:hypothetical protein